MLTRLLILMAVASCLFMVTPDADAARRAGKITGKTVGAGVLSLLIWPGIGQAINDQPGKKIGTHAVIGLLPPFRFWSGYDALVNRQGGYWKERI